MTASAPATSACRRLTVSIGNRPLTFGVTSTTPMSAAWVSDGPNAVERADELGFEYQDSRGPPSLRARRRSR